MKIKATIITIVFAASMGMTANVFSGDMEGQVLIPVTEPGASELAGDTYRTYKDATGKVLITVFRFKGVRVQDGEDIFSGSWSFDAETGQVSIQRFDSYPELKLSLFSANGTDGYVIKFKGSGINGLEAGSLLMPETVSDSDRVASYHLGVSK
jgi:hypothetical protein